jgi:hypothetical protein
LLIFEAEDVAQPPSQDFQLPEQNEDEDEDEDEGRNLLANKRETPRDGQAAAPWR